MNMSPIRSGLVFFLILGRTYLALASDPMITLVGTSGVQTDDLPAQLYTSLTSYSVHCGTSCPNLNWDQPNQTVVLKDVDPSTREEVIAISCKKIPEGRESRHHICDFNPALGDLQTANNIVFRSIHHSVGSVHAPSASPETATFQRSFVQLKPSIFMIRPEDTVSYGEIRCNCTANRRDATQIMRFDDDASCEYDVPIITRGTQALQKLNTLTQSRAEIRQVIDGMAPSSKFHLNDDVISIQYLSDHHFYSINFGYSVNEEVRLENGSISDVYFWVKGMSERGSLGAPYYSTIETHVSRFYRIRMD